MTALIIHVGEDWLRLDGVAPNELAAYPKIEEAALIVFDLGTDMVSGAISLEGSPVHAPVLVNRRLTADGTVDGDSRVLIHAVEKSATGYTACFSAIPAGHWQRLESWSSAQRRVCVLVPLIALMWQRTTAQRAVAAQIGREFVFVARVNKRIVHCATLAFSCEPGDLDSAVRSLADRVRQELSTTMSLPAGFSVEWHSAFSRTTRADGAASSQSLADLFFEQAEISGNVAPVQAYRAGDSCVETSIATLVTARSFFNGVNPLSQLLCWAAERWIVGWSIACCAIALTGMLGAGALLAHAHAISAQAQQVRVNASQIEARARTLELDAVMPADFDSWSRQIVAQDETRKRFDVNRTVGILGDAAQASGVRVLRVYSSPGAGVGRLDRRPGGSAVPDVPAVVVDGAFPTGAAEEHVPQLARFVEFLRTRGLAATPVDTAGGKVSGNVLAQVFTYRLEPVVRSGGAP